MAHAHWYYFSNGTFSLLTTSMVVADNSPKVVFGEKGGERIIKGHKAGYACVCVCLALSLLVIQSMLTERKRTKERGVQNRK